MQVFGDAVLDQTRYMVISTGNDTVFIRRTGPLYKDLQISPTVCVDGSKGQLLPTACWLYVMRVGSTHFFPCRMSELRIRFWLR